jgi:hypothetical protein
MPSIDGFSLCLAVRDDLQLFDLPGVSQDGRPSAAPPDAREGSSRNSWAKCLRTARGPRSTRLARWERHAASCPFAFGRVQRRGRAGMSDAPTGGQEGSIMAHTKPILAVSSAALGAALALVAVHIQRDRFAFTTQERRNFDVPTSVTVMPPREPAATATPAVLPEQIPVVEIEALQVVPDTPPAPKARKRAATEENPKSAQPPCRPGWRELESGPAGRRVREICEPAAPDDVPRS